MESTPESTSLRKCHPNLVIWKPIVVAKHSSCILNDHSKYPSGIDFLEQQLSRHSFFWDKNWFAAQPTPIVGSPLEGSKAIEKSKYFFFYKWPIKDQRHNPIGTSKALVKCWRASPWTFGIYHEKFAEP